MRIVFDMIFFISVKSECKGYQKILTSDKISPSQDEPYFIHSRFPYKKKLINAVSTIIYHLCSISFLIRSITDKIPENNIFIGIVHV
jgi:hypothetical protein